MNSYNKAHITEKSSNKKLGRKEEEIAYFSMEIAIDEKIPTYSGGLGVLAGDTIRACSELNLPIVGVTMLFKKGYFQQEMDGSGNQMEKPVQWDPSHFLQKLDKQIELNIEGETVVVQAWRYRIRCNDGYFVPVIFLDTDIEANSDYHRSLSHYLYGGDKKYRLSQECVLGVGGVRMLEELGYDRISRYHMNEGHSSLLTLELLKREQDKPEENQIASVKSKCLFTTHTPVPAGHDKFTYDMVSQVLGDFLPLDFLKRLGGEETLNLTLLALNLSYYVNGVAKEHRQTASQMFPGYKIDSVTNGIYSEMWVCRGLKELFDEHIPEWRKDPFTLRYALSIPDEQVWQAHVRAKKDLLDTVKELTGEVLDNNTLTIGFARRATAYKRLDLLFYDMERLKSICSHAEKIQVIYSGKAHPKDSEGKEQIRKVLEAAEILKEDIKVVFLENYDLALAKILIPGVDLWLNTPRKPLEASGTSGMKAAHNGVPSLSVLDGWWIEGCIEGLTGWAIESPKGQQSNDSIEAESIYDKLQNKIIPVFYHDRQRWIHIMKHCIAINGSFFNSHRMMMQYALNAYMD